MPSENVDKETVFSDRPPEPSWLPSRIQKAEKGEGDSKNRVARDAGDGRGNGEVGEEDSGSGSILSSSSVSWNPRTVSRKVTHGAVVTCSVFCPFLGHSMMDTLAVALRVAEEAIEEAISKAESHGDSLVGPPSCGGGSK